MSGAEIQTRHEHPPGTALMKSWAGVKVSSVGSLAVSEQEPTFRPLTGFSSLFSRRMHRKHHLYLFPLRASDNGSE